MWIVVPRAPAETEINMHVTRILSPGGNSRAIQFALNVDC